MVTGNSHWFQLKQRDYSGKGRTNIEGFRREKKYTVATPAFCQ